MTPLFRRKKHEASETSVSADAAAETPSGVPDTAASADHDGATPSLDWLNDAESSSAFTSSTSTTNRLRKRGSLRWNSGATTSLDGDDAADSGSHSGSGSRSASSSSSAVSSHSSESAGSAASPDSAHDGGAPTAAGSSARTAPSSSHTPAPQPLSRAGKIAKAYHEWHDELLERAKEGQPKISASDSAVIDVTNPHPTGIAQLNSGMDTRISSLIREERSLAEALRKLEGLHSRRTRVTRRYGYAPITYTIGRVSWSELPEDESRKPVWATDYDLTGELSLEPGELENVAASVLTAKGESEHAGSEGAATHGTPAPSAPGADSGEVTLTAIESRSEVALFRAARLTGTGRDAVVTLTKECTINPALLRALYAHGATKREVTGVRQALAENIDAGMHALYELCRLHLPGFSFTRENLLGCFVNPADTILRDMESLEPYIATSSLVAALTGDEETIETLTAALPEASRHDRSPYVERGVGDRDVEELAIVEEVAAGRSLVVNTVPGTERAGTLAAIMADAVASHRSVLYIPGNPANRLTVLDEYERLGLADIALDFSDIDYAVSRLRTGMRQEPVGDDPSDTHQIREGLSAARQELEEYMAALHATNPTWGMSVHSTLGYLAELTTRPMAPRTRVRLATETALMVRERHEEIAQMLRKASTLGAFDLRHAGSPWARTPIADDAAAAAAVAVVKELNDVTLPQLRNQLVRAAAETGMHAATTVHEWFEQIDVLAGISQTLDIFQPHIFERNAMDMVIATATKEWRAERGDVMRSGERRRLTKQARELLRPGVDVADLHAALDKAQRQRDVWRKYSREGGLPKLPEGMTAIIATARTVKEQLAQLTAATTPATDLIEMQMGELQAYVRALALDAQAMDVLPSLNAVMSQLKSLGLQVLLEDFAQRSIEPAFVANELELSFLNTVFDDLLHASPSLMKHGPASLSELLERFRRLDKQQTETLVWPVKRTVASITREMVNTRRHDVLAIDEALAHRGPGVLRDLIATYPRQMQVIRPVWIMPPLTVSEFIPSMPWADLVIIDDVNSLPMCDLIPLLMRGRQVVILGDVIRDEGATEGKGDGKADSKADGKGDGKAESRSEAHGERTNLQAFTEILPVVSLPTVRTQHDVLSTLALIEHGYEDVLQVIPGIADGQHSHLIVVDGKGVPKPSTGLVEAPEAEVNTVFDLVVDHVLSKPEKSLGVIAVNETHASRLRDMLREEITKSPSLAALAKPSREPFTIVDIEHAAGLRRDRIILTVGLGKTVHGRVLHSFGNLATRAGLTGLIDSIEAPREELTIVSCFAPGDIDTSRISSPGPLLLARLLNQAGGEESPELVATGSALSDPLLEDLARRLREAGWEVCGNYGTSGSVKIPLVVGHADIPGTWAVAVVVDDDAYVSEPSLRRRDRYWLERLENRGWQVYQTFSTSLFIDPVGQVDAIVDKLIRARTLARRAAVVNGLGGAAGTGGAAQALPPVPGGEGGASGTSGASGGGASGAGASGAGASGAAAARGTAPANGRTRSNRPKVTPGLPLAAYSDDELDDLAAWIMADGVARTETSLASELRSELGITRRGAQVDAVLGNVARRSLAALATPAPAGSATSSSSSASAESPDACD